MASASDPLIGAAKTLRVRSVLNSLLWLAAVATPAFFSFAYAFRADVFIERLLVGVGLLPTLFALGWYSYFAKVRPEMLQSEDYQLKSAALQWIQGKTGPIVIDASSLPAIMNPIVNALPPAQEPK